MFHDQLKWIVSRPQFPPNIHVAVKVDTKSYIENDIKPPSAYMHREADFLVLADTEAQCTIMGPNQLARLPLSRSDLIAEIELKGANVNLMWMEMNWWWWLLASELAEIPTKFMLMNNK